MAKFVAKVGFEDIFNQVNAKKEALEIEVKKAFEERAKELDSLFALVAVAVVEEEVVEPVEEEQTPNEQFIQG